MERGKSPQNNYMMQEREVIILAVCVSCAVVLLIMIICCLCLRKHNKWMWSEKIPGHRYRSNTLAERVKGLDLIDSRPVSKETRPISKDSVYLQQTAVQGQIKQNGGIVNNAYQKEENKTSVPTSDLQQRVSDRSSRMTDQLSGHYVVGYGEVRMVSTYGQAQTSQRDSDFRIEAMLRDSSGSNNRSSKTNSSTPVIISNQTKEQSNSGYVQEQVTPSRVKEQPRPQRASQEIQQLSIRYDKSKLGLVRKEDRAREPKPPAWVTGGASPVQFRKSTNQSHVISAKRKSSARASRSYDFNNSPRTSSHRVSQMTQKLGTSMGHPVIYYPVSPDVPQYHPSPYGAPPRDPQGVADPRLSSSMAMDLGADFEIAFPMMGGNRYPSYHYES